MEKITIELELPTVFELYDVVDNLSFLSNNFNIKNSILNLNLILENVTPKFIDAKKDFIFDFRQHYTDLITNILVGRDSLNYLTRELEHAVIRIREIELKYQQ